MPNMNVHFQNLLSQIFSVGKNLSNKSGKHTAWGLKLVHNRFSSGP